MAPPNHLDPVVVAQLGNLQLRARRLLDGIYSGRHTNINRGHAQDFSEHRPYNPGDDLRSLDWKVFGRTDKLVVRQFEEQTNIGAVVVIDDSASMGYSQGGRLSKLEYAKTMAAALGYLVVSQHDAVGLLSSHVSLPPQSQKGHLENYFRLLEDLNPHGVFQFRSIQESVLSLARKRSFVLFFSDLMEKTEEVISVVQFLSSLRHEVIVFQVLDSSELDLSFDGPVCFKDLETGYEIETEPNVLRRRYKEWINKKLSSLEQRFLSLGAEYTLLQTHIPFEKGLGPFLSWRGARV